MAVPATLPDVHRDALSLDPLPGAVETDQGDCTPYSVIRTEYTDTVPTVQGWLAKGGVRACGQIYNVDSIIRRRQDTRRTKLTLK